MKSQVKWGIAMIIIGLVISLFAFGFPFLLIYAVPLILIGAGLIVYKGREEIIEEVVEEDR